MLIRGYFEWQQCTSVYRFRWLGDERQPIAPPLPSSPLPLARAALRVFSNRFFSFLSFLILFCVVSSGQCDLVCAEAAGSSGLQILRDHLNLQGFQNGVLHHEDTSVDSPQRHRR